MSNSRFVWLASYPRSGNTWLRFLLDSLSRQGDKVDINSPTVRAPVSNRHEFDDIFGIDSTLLSADEIERARPELLPRILEVCSDRVVFRKVHERWRKNMEGVDLFAPKLSLGAVYIVRDPRDVAVSLASFASVTIDAAIRTMSDPEFTFSDKRDRYEDQLRQPLGTWSAHVQSWLDQDGMPVFLLRYEDLLADTTGQLARVAEFLALPAEGAARAAQAAAFETLRGQEDDQGFRELRNLRTRFFREGNSGQWRTALSLDQAEQIKRDHGETMERLGYV